MSKDINKISVDELYKLIENHEPKKLSLEEFVARSKPATQEDIDAYAERVRKREEQFKKDPGAHHPIDLDYRYGDCTDD